MSKDLKHSSSPSFSTLTHATLDTWTMAAWSKNQNQESFTGWTWLLKSM